MVIQWVIVSMLIVTAAWYLGKTMYKSWQGKSCETGACKCDSHALTEPKKR